MLQALLLFGVRLSLFHFIATPVFTMIPAPEDLPTAQCGTSSPSDADRPVADVHDFGARGNGLDDDTEAIVRAVASLDRGGTVFFPPGTYPHSDVVTVRPPNVTLAGRQAVLYATNPDRAAIVVSGDNNVVRDLYITSRAPDARGQVNEQSGSVQP